MTVLETGMQAGGGGEEESEVSVWDGRVGCEVMGEFLCAVVGTSVRLPSDLRSTLVRAETRESTTEGRVSRCKDRSSESEVKGFLNL